VFAGSRPFGPLPLAAEIPALLIPILEPPQPRNGMRDRFPSPPGFLVVRLNLDCLRHEILPPLIERDFPEGARDYQLMIVATEPTRKVVFALQGVDPRDATDRIEADVVCRFFGLLPDVVQKRRAELRLPGPMPAWIPFGGPPPRQSPETGRQIAGNQNGAWTLLIRHRSGSLEAAVEQTRRRNLAVSVGVLLVLGGSVALLLVATRRAHALARRQVEFVAGVTHELRTPLAVVCSAGENLSDGLVEDPHQVKHYGELIKSQGRRLTDMVEQILEYAGAEAGQARESSPVQIAGLIDDVLAACRVTIDAAGATVQKKLEEGLPTILADRSALSRALQNLLDNAIKYSGRPPWIEVSAEKSVKRGTPGLVVSVQDHGIGIPDSDLPHVFEPFYRGRAAAQGSVRGNGLGLSLVRSIVESHRGRVTAQSRLGAGSRFSIWLPALAAGQRPAPGTTPATNEGRGDERQYPRNRR
jgi:signal transduction histidine kinase